MIDLAQFRDLRIHGGLNITQIEFADSLVDAFGRQVLAKTRITGRELYLEVTSGLSERELSVTIYHEVLEAMTVAVSNPPGSVMEFNEADFERAGYAAHEQF